VVPAAIALIAGAAAGIAFQLPARISAWLLAAFTLASALTWSRRANRLTCVLLLGAFASAGVALGARARGEAIDTPLRRALDREFGGFVVDATTLQGQRAPIATRFTLVEDASTDADGTTLRATVVAVRPRDAWLAVDGGVVISVGGAPNAQRADAWRRGRVLEAPVTFRRPARYLDAGVPDFERQAALDGVSLLGSIKSGLLIDVVARGSMLDERAADIRAFVRRAMARRVAPRSELSAAIVDAVLIGDRSGLPDEIRTRLQAAGTYHVIAISGGNIAILAGVLVVLFSMTGASGRLVAAATLALLLAYAEIVTAGPSVWRATYVAAAYLIARLLDHRSTPWQAMALAGAIIAIVAPIDVRNAGFILTFGATAALLEVGRRAPLTAGSNRVLTWLATSMGTSLAVEAALLPVMAATFSRVTAAGIVLNLVAVPAMAVVQVAGMAAVAVDRIDAAASLAGWVAHAGATAIVDSARLVEIVPWLTARVPPPSITLVIAYYAAIAALVSARTAAIRVAACVGIAAAAVLVVEGVNGGPASREPMLGGTRPTGVRLTMLDVGQGDALVLQSGGRTLMVDTGGSPFGDGSFDIGARVVEPALWGIGITSLDAMLLTHGDPDHIGGATALVADFHPREVWQGIPVPRAASLSDVLRRAVASGARVSERREGEQFDFGDAHIVVLHPGPPDWERPKVRNDDSVVLEVIDHDVTMLLTGDIGSDVEREILPRLAHTKTRILKVAHHGSRTSTSEALLDAWRPQMALISAGRGNPFGHPAPDVVARLEASGAAIYRTDRDGEITVDTDGASVSVETFESAERDPGRQ
jgi:competence protein ComEC